MNSKGVTWSDLEGETARVWAIKTLRIRDLIKVDYEIKRGNANGVAKAYKDYHQRTGNVPEMGGDYQAALKRGDHEPPNKKNVVKFKKKSEQVSEAGYNDLPQTKAEVKKKFPDTETDVKNKNSSDLQPVKYK